MISINQNQIFDYLEKKGLKPVLQKESGQVYITTEVNKAELHTFFVILAEGSILQLISYIPLNFLDSAKNDVARLLHILNKDVDMPGFGMDEKEKLIFYRAVIPCLNKEVSGEYLDLIISASKAACEAFMGIIGVVATGTSKLDQLLADFKKAQEKNAP